MTSRCKGNWAAIGLFLGVSVVRAATVEATAACGGDGLGGTLREGALAVHFEGCEPEGGALTARIWSEPGQMLSELAMEGDHFQYRIGGVPIGGTPTGTDIAALETALGSPEAALASRLLVHLLALGHDSRAPGMRALGVALVGFETGGQAPLAARIAEVESVDSLDASCKGCRSKRTVCRGCCGPGCMGCSGVCTDACKRHDDCVRAFGHANPKCLGIVELAARSYLSCMYSPHFPNCCETY